MSNFNATDLRRHRQNTIRNPKAWVELDFEMISDNLGIEINQNMSPAVVRLAIEGRFNEMSGADYGKVPDEVIEYLANLNALGKFSIEYNLKNNSTKLYPFKLVKEDKTTLSLSPIGTTFSRFEELVDQNLGLNTYCEESGARIIFGEDKVIIQCDLFYPWPEKQLTQIIKSFDVYATPAN